MHAIRVEKELNVPLDALWAVVADFSNLSWFPAAESVEKVGDGVGEIRRITMAGMPEAIEERLDAINPEEHTLTYRVLENSVNIMQDYTVVANLSKASESTTIASWQGSFSGVSVDIEPQVMIDLMTETYGSMLEQMAAAAVKT